MHRQWRERLTLARPEYTEPVFNLEKRAMVGALDIAMFGIKKHIGLTIEPNAEMRTAVAVGNDPVPLAYDHHFALRSFHADGIAIGYVIKAAESQHSGLPNGARL